MTTLIRLLNSPLLQVAGLVFDCELAVGRGQTRDYTRRRVAAGVSLGDHSRLREREWSLEGAVAGTLQLQNLTRPGTNPLGALASAGAAIANQFGAGLSTRLDDFEDSLVSVMQEGDEVDVVTKAPGAAARRFRAVVREWSATSTATGPDSGDAAIYRLSVLEVLRAGALGLAAATLEALGLNGSATANSLGPTQSPAVSPDLVP